MGTSAVQDDPMLRLRYYKETGQAGEAATYERYLRDTGQFRASNAAAARQRQNANDQELAAAAQEPSGLSGYAQRLATHVLNAAQGIPGMEAVEAGAGALGSQLTDHPMTYRQSLATLRDATGHIGGKTSAVEKMMGGVATLPFLPANPAAAGAVLGGADQLLSADPDQGVGGRLLRTGMGAATGAVLGKTLDLGATAIRGARATPAAENIIARITDRTQAAKDLYERAFAGAKGREPTQAVLKFLAQPDIANIVEHLQATRPFQGVEASDPKMLDAIYKTLSDQQAVVRKGLAQPEPGKPNIGRFTGRNIGAAQEQLLSALETPGSKRVMTAAEVPAVPDRVVQSPTTAQSPKGSLRDILSDFDRAKGLAAIRQSGTSDQARALQGVDRHLAEQARPTIYGSPGERVIPGTPAIPAQYADQTLPAMMPSYRNAVQDFATRSGDIEAVKRGVDALRVAQRTTVPSAKSLAKVTPEAFAEWAKTATPSQIDAAKEGILGALKGSPKVMWAKFFGVPIIPHPSRSLNAAGGLLRIVDPNSGAAAKAGLLSMQGF